MKTVIKHKNDPLKSRVYFKKNRETISPIHDIKLYPISKKKNIVNMVVEIPRGSQAKMEMSTKEKYNPIKQDVKNGKLRFVHYPYPFNYGALPQTWENPEHKDPYTNYYGDGDPIDVCEIGSIKSKLGDVIQVKVLGVWAMIDEGETDWKIVCINVKDPLASRLNDIESVEKELPGVLDYYYTFLRDYKIPAGSKPNKFAFNGDIQRKNFACKIIKDVHKQWRTAKSNKKAHKDQLLF